MATQTRFECTPGGTIARGRRRLALLLSALAGLMTIFAMLVWLRGALLPGLLALAVAGAAGLAWRMSSNLEPKRLIVSRDELDIRLRWGRVRIPLAGLRARRLSEEETLHLERLVSVGLFTASSGGFDSHLLGEFDLYASDLARAVLVESAPPVTEDGEVDPEALQETVRAIVTPDETDSFLALVAASPPATIPSP